MARKHKRCSWTAVSLVIADYPYIHGADPVRSVGRDRPQYCARLSRGRRILARRSGRDSSYMGDVERTARRKRSAPSSPRGMGSDIACDYILPNSEQRSEGTLSSPWWSIPQAIIWIVTRSESQVLRADGVRTVAGLGRMTGMKWASDLNEPPVSLSAAPDELLQVWQARRIALFGRKWGKEPSRLILGLSGPHLRDYRGEVCLADKTLYIDTRLFWSNLSVRADDCLANAAGLWAFGVRTPSLGRRSARVHRREAESAQNRTKESRPRRAAEGGHEPL